MKKKDNELIKILKPSKFKEKSLRSLRREEQKKEPIATSSQISDGCCPACNEIANKIFDLKKRGGYYIQQKQDEAVWMPLTESEIKAGKNLIRSHKHARLCAHCEPLTNGGWVKKWQMVPGHKRSVFPIVGKWYNQRSDAGVDADIKTNQDLQAGNIKYHITTALDDSNTDMDQTFYDLYGFEEKEAGFQEQENWRLIVYLYFPPHHVRMGIRQIARELNLNPSYVSREINKMKAKLRDAIEQVLTSKKDFEKKIILFQYYLEQKTQAEISDIIGEKQKDVQRITRRYKKKIREALMKNGVFTLEVKGDNFF